MPSNKKKNINDPLYGFLTLPFDILLDLIQHPYFQRLRNIKQLGLSHLVFPGATHTRLHHALGALYLTSQAVLNLRLKGVDVSDEEFEAVCIAILLHDLGHGPFSHALEHSIVENQHHETISLAMMHKMNQDFNGSLGLAIEIFMGTYHKPFLHQLVSSQLDMDRLDYLRRDSFYTGVTEGVVSSDRIIKMLNVCDGNLVVEEKGIYSIEKFIVARRLMYWQVYLHKTVVAAEQLLILILKRAKELTHEGMQLFATEPLQYFLQRNETEQQPTNFEASLEMFSRLDDSDIICSVKAWMRCSDFVLEKLCSQLVARNLPKVIVQKEVFDAQVLLDLKLETTRKMNIDLSLADYFVFTGVLENHAYTDDKQAILLQHKNGKLTDLAEASDNYNVHALMQIVRKHFLCFSK